MKSALPKNQGFIDMNPNAKFYKYVKYYFINYRIFIYIPDTDILTRPWKI